MSKRTYAETIAHIYKWFKQEIQMTRTPRSEMKKQCSLNLSLEQYGLESVIASAIFISDTDSNCKYRDILEIIRENDRQSKHKIWADIQVMMSMLFSPAALPMELNFIHVLILLLLLLDKCVRHDSPQTIIIINAISVSLQSFHYTAQYSRTNKNIAYYLLKSILMFSSNIEVNVMLQ